VVLLQGGPHRLVVAEPLQDPGLVPAQGLEQHRDALLALAVDPHAHAVALVDLELEPGAAGRDHLAAEDVLVRGLVDLALEVDTRGPDQLGDHDPLGAVDDERALAGHEREVAHEDGLALDLARAVVDELRRDEHRGGVGHVLVLALLDGVLGRLEPVVAEREGHGPGEVLDRGDLLEDLLEARLAGKVLVALLLLRAYPGPPALVAEQPVKGVGLQGEQIRNLERLLDTGEGNAMRTGNDS
jgi:hypothetical protein